MTAKNMNIVVLTKSGPHRDPIRKSLVKEGYKVSFASSIQDGKSLCANEKPGFFIHDLSTTDPSQGWHFQRGLAKNETHAEMQRIMVVEEIDDQISALANDTNIVRLVLFANATINIAQEVAACGEPALTYEQLMVRAKKDPDNYNQEKIDQTIEDAYDMFPSNPKAKMDYASLEFRNENYGEAEQLSRQLINDNPSNVRAMNLLSRCLMKQGKPEDALNILTDANNLAPDSSDRLSLMGKAHFQKGDIGTARDFYNKAIQIDPKSKSAREGLSETYCYEGKYNEALAAFDDALSEDEIASFFNNGAVIAVKEKDLTKALRLYETAYKGLTSDRFRAPILFNIALSHRRLKEYDKALDYLNQALEYKKGFAKAHKQIEEIKKLIAKKTG